MGLPAGGVGGMKLKKKDRIVYCRRSSIPTASW